MQTLSTHEVHQISGGLSPIAFTGFVIGFLAYSAAYYYISKHPEWNKPPAPVPGTSNPNLITD